MVARLGISSKKNKKGNELKEKKICTSISTLPESGSTKRNARRSSVDFPDPVGPTMASDVPPGALRETSFRTGPEELRRGEGSRAEEAEEAEADDEAAAAAAAGGIARGTAAVAFVAEAAAAALLAAAMPTTFSHENVT